MKNDQLFAEIYKSYTGAIAPFNPYATINDRAAWNLIDKEWRDGIVKSAEELLSYSFPSLSACDFMAFSRTGNRTEYEAKLFTKRINLSTFSLAECVEDKGRFLDVITDGIFSICEESAWWLPAHNTYIRDTPQLLLPDATDPVLDLFSCETGAVLATVKYLLEDRLNAVSPFICKRISHEISTRIITPYLNRHFWWMGMGDEPMCNWTIWCTQNVLLSAFLGFFAKSRNDGFSPDCADYISKDILNKIVGKACESTDYFLKDYGNDGCCDEGAQYYRHAGLCLYNTMEILNSTCNNAFEELYKNRKIINIASYIHNVHVNDKYYINFADCSAVAGRCTSREYLFAKKINNEKMMAFAADDFIKGGTETLLLTEENNLYYRLQHAFCITELRDFSKKAKKTGESFSAPDSNCISYVNYESVGLYIARTASVCLAVKAGDNNDSHNHNDTGSITLYKNGLPLLIDVGVESYSKKTFSKDRYDIWTMQSSYHNLPTINGYMQKDGAKYRATDITLSEAEDRFEISMDIGAAYPEEAGVKSYIRTVSLSADNTVTLTDVCNLGNPDLSGTCCVSSDNGIVLSLMSYEKPEINENEISFGTLSKAHFSGVVIDKVEEIPIEDARLMKAWKHPIYRILLISDNNQSDKYYATISFK